MAEEAQVFLPACPSTAFAKMSGVVVFVRYVVGPAVMWPPSPHKLPSCL